MPDRAEAEPAVELLGPVGGVGEQEDRVRALGAGRVDRREHGGRGMAAAPAALERADLVDLGKTLGGRG